MTTRVTALAVLSSLLVAAPCAAAGLGDTQTAPVAIARQAGTCPRAIAVRSATHGYEGGVTIEIVPQMFAAAFASELISATRARIVFRASLRPAFASCRGTGHTADGMHAFDLRDGSVEYRLTTVRGPNETLPVIMDLSAEGQNPRLKIAFSD